MQHGIISPEINLCFNGKLLQDEHTLRDYGVGPLSTLLLSEIFLVYVVLTRLPRATSRTKLISIKIASTDRIADIINQVIEKEHLPHSSNQLILISLQGLLENNNLISEYSIWNESLSRLESK